MADKPPIFMLSDVNLLCRFRFKVIDGFSQVNDLSFVLVREIQPLVSLFSKA